jgi:hypothetical protein
MNISENIFFSESLKAQELEKKDQYDTPCGMPNCYSNKYFAE